MLPVVKNKNRQARVVVLNDTAQAIVEKMLGQHPVYVFTWVNENGGAWSRDVCGRKLPQNHREGVNRLLRNGLRKIGWVVYAKRPFAGPEAVLHPPGRHLQLTTLELG